MALFDLGTEVRLVREVRASLKRAFELSRQVVQGYEAMGFKVAFKEEAAPERLVAEITDTQGTRITTRVKLAGGQGASRLEIQLEGRIQVGGMAGMFASESKVRSVAKEKLGGLLDKVFANIGPDPEPEPEPTPAPAPTPPIAAATAAPANPAGRSVEERLGVLKQMFDKGLIGEADFRKKKQEILGDL